MEKEKFDFNKIIDFDEHIDMSIPDYSNMLDTIIKISDYFVDEQTNVYDIGCSTGKLFKKMNLNDGVDYIGIDNSTLIDRAEEKHNTFFCKDDIIHVDMKNASFITSIFTLQFLSRNKRKMVINQINQALNKNGAVIVCEKTYSKNAMLQDIINSLYYEYKEKHFDVAEILKKEKRLRKSFKLNNLDELIEELSVIGDVEIFWRQFNFVGMIIIKK